MLRWTERLKSTKRVLKKREDYARSRLRQLPRHGRIAAGGRHSASSLGGGCFGLKFAHRGDQCLKRRHLRSSWIEEIIFQSVK